MAGPSLYSPGFYADVPSIVHNLILDMKALEATLRRWSCSQATPEDVSDCYVQFGVEFNAVVSAFEGYDIPTNDLHVIPSQLRSALEGCLGEVPSLDTLHWYMPEIRRLLSELLHGLRAKHSAWRNAIGRSPTTPSSHSHSPGGVRLSRFPFP